MHPVHCLKAKGNEQQLPSLQTISLGKATYRDSETAFVAHTRGIS